MTHVARKRSESGYYHVVPKGLGDQIIFDDDEDRRLYLGLLAEAKRQTEVRVHAYCLMSNHVHLAIEDPEDRLSEALKIVHERYGSYYAEKTGRRGGIFGKPCWSEPIETDEYLLCAVRYIHANPAAAGICPASAYEWSSVRDYLGRRQNGISDTEMVLDMVGGVPGLIEFSKPQNWTAMPFAGSRLRRHLGDDETLRIAKAVAGDDVVSLRLKGKDERSAAVKLLSAHGFTESRIVRLTGLGRKEVAAFM